MFQDILRESWVYEEIGQEFLEQGFEKGREEERKQGLQRQRQMLVSIVQTHFPEITTLAMQQAEGIKDPDVLQNLILKLIATQKLEEAKKILFEADKQ